MNWSFAIINNKLAEIYFERTKGESKILGHCYVKKEEFRTKKEQKIIEEDILNNQLVYRNGGYKRVNFMATDSHSNLYG